MAKSKRPADDTPRRVQIEVRQGGTRTVTPETTADDAPVAAADTTPTHTQE